jgi:hypothetical protein
LALKTKVMQFGLMDKLMLAFASTVIPGSGLLEFHE